MSHYGGVGEKINRKEVDIYLLQNASNDMGNETHKTRVYIVWMVFIVNGSEEVYDANRDVKSYITPTRSISNGSYLHYLRI